jgi:protein-S-isoprenylcysteine O-methyltransferase Ste14
MALPGFFAGYLPWRFFGLSKVRPESIGAAQIPALACIGAGAALLAMCAFVNVFVIGYEEPTLGEMFGRSYEDYTRRVGRWIPKL